MFDDSINYGIEEINIFEKELRILGFKKFKTSPTTFIFKNVNSPNIEIKKDSYDKNGVEYGFYIDREYDGDMLYIRDGEHINNKDKYYKKYFNNKLRKYKIGKLLEEE